MKYHISEVFGSIQGEGGRAGTYNVFVRFAGCNQRCAVAPGPHSPGGFDCDTDFAATEPLTFEQLLTRMDACWPRGIPERWCVLTGGEPGLQATAELLTELHQHGWKIAIETNGSIALPMCDDPGGIVDLNDRLSCYYCDWITVSPKVAEHCVRQKVAHEVRYVRGNFQALPRPRCEALHHFLSPAFDGDHINPNALAWCQQLIKDNPTWRLSVQIHKLLRIR